MSVRIDVLLALKSQLDGLNSALSGIATLGKSLAALATAYVGYRATLGNFKEVAALGAELQALHMKTGVAASSLVMMRRVFKDSGVDASYVGNTIALMQKHLVDTAAAGDKGSKALAGLNLKASELVQLRPEQQFKAIGERLEQIENPAVRAAYAMELFGRSGKEIVGVFGEKGRIAESIGAVSKFADVMGRDAKAYHDISVALDRIKGKALQFYAGVGDIFVNSLVAPLKKLASIDLTPIGQRVGAFLALVVEGFGNGEAGQIIALAIQAGFEEGAAAGSVALTKAFEIFTKPDFWRFSGGMFLGLAQGLSRVAMQFYLEMQNVWASLSVFISSNARAWVAPFSNALADALNKITPGGNYWKKMQATPGISFSDAWMTGQKEIDAAMADFVKMQNDGIEGLSYFLGLEKNVTGEVVKQGTASQKLLDLINKRVAAREREAKASQKPPTQFDGVKFEEDLTKKLNEEITAREKLREINQQMGEIDSNWALISEQRYSEKVKLLDEERTVLDDLVKLLEEKAKLESTSEADRKAIEERISGYRSEIGGLKGRKSAFGPDPNSFTQNIGAEFADTMNKMGTVAQNTARLISSPFRGAFNGISQSLQGLIRGTMTWRQALVNVGSTIAQSVVQAFSDMVTAWIVRRTMMFVFGRTMDAAELGANAGKNAAIVTQEGATGAAVAAAWTPAAMLKSIASWGLAAIVGAAILMSVMAAAGGFYSGGYTGDGGRMEPAGVVHRGEYVFDAPTVQRIGVGRLDDIRSGRSASYAEGGYVGDRSETSSSRPNVRVGILKNRQDLRQFMMQEGWKIVADEFSRRSNRLNG